MKPTLDQLKARLSRLRAQSSEFLGTVYRSSTPKYANESDILTGDGGRRNGGRWNPIGIAVVYASLTPETAMAETLAHHRYYGIPVEEAMPRTFVAIEIRLHSVLDIRDGLIRQRLQVSLERLLSHDWRKAMRAGQESVAQTIGRAAADVGIEALIVPSAVDANGHNLVVFPDNLLGDSEMCLLNADRLFA